MKYLLPVLICLLFITSSFARKEGTEQRDRFMRTWVLATEEMEMRTERDIQRALQAMDDAVAIGETVDKNFLAWVDEGLPAAFQSLIDSQAMFAAAIRTDSDRYMEIGNIAMRRWNDYWTVHGADVLKKLKAR